MLTREFSRRNIGGAGIALRVGVAPAFSVGSQWKRTSGPTYGLYKECQRLLLKGLSPLPAGTLAILQESDLHPYHPRDVKVNHFGYGANPFHRTLQY